MKTLNIFLTILILFIFSSCAKKPEACISASTENPSLGQEVTFTDCSKNAEESTINFGDGKEVNIDNTINHSFIKDGNHKVTISIKNKKDKEDNAELSITVKTPTKSELEGKWKFYKNEQWIDWQEGFSDEIQGTSYENEEWNFNSDSVIVTDNGYILSYSYQFNIYGELELIFTDNYQSTTSYKLVKIYGNDMTLRFGEGTGWYYLYYFKRN